MHRAKIQKVKSEESGGETTAGLAVAALQRELTIKRAERLESLRLLADGEAAAAHAAGMTAEVSAAQESLEYVRQAVDHNEEDCALEPSTPLHAAVMELTLACLETFRAAHFCLHSGRRDNLTDQMRGLVQQTTALVRALCGPAGIGHVPDGVMESVVELLEQRDRLSLAACSRRMYALVGGRWRRVAIRLRRTPRPHVIASWENSPAKWLQRHRCVSDLALSLPPLLLRPALVDSLAGLTRLESLNLHLPRAHDSLEPSAVVEVGSWAAPLGRLRRLSVAAENLAFTQDVRFLTALTSLDLGDPRALGNDAVMDVEFRNHAPNSTHSASPLPPPTLRRLLLDRVRFNPSDHLPWVAAPFLHRYTALRSLVVQELYVPLRDAAWARVHSLTSLELNVAACGAEDLGVVAGMRGLRELRLAAKWILMHEEGQESEEDEEEAPGLMAAAMDSALGSFSSLAALTLLDLARTGWEAVPGSLALLTGLRQLSLRHNSHLAPLPATVSELRHLQRLSIDHASLRASRDGGRLPSLPSLEELQLTPRPAPDSDDAADAVPEQLVLWSLGPLLADLPSLRAIYDAAGPAEAEAGETWLSVGQGAHPARRPVRVVRRPWPHDSRALEGWGGAER